jgi:hypothetical protein
MDQELNELPVYEYIPRIPSLQELKELMQTSHVTVTYNPLADELFVVWRVPAEFAVSVFLDDPEWLAMRVDPDTNDLVGFHIITFLDRAIREWPELAWLAKRAGVPEHFIEGAYHQGSEADRVRTVARLLTCLAETT